MGTVKTLSLKSNFMIPLILLILIILYYLFFYSLTYKHHLYNYFDDGISGKLIKYSGILPIGRYNKMFLEQVAQESPKIILVSIKKSNGWSNVIFIDKKGKDYIMVSSLNIDRSFQPIDNNDLARMILKFLNKNAFNKYVKELGAFEKRDIIIALIDVFKWSSGDQNFILLDNQKVFRDLYNQQFDSVLNEKNLLLSKETLIRPDFANEIPILPENSIYIWSKFTGIIRLDILFNENNYLRSIDAKFIGRFGSEMYY